MLAHCPHVSQITQNENVNSEYTYHQENSLIDSSLALLIMLKIMVSGMTSSCSTQQIIPSVLHHFTLSKGISPLSCLSKAIQLAHIPCRISFFCWTEACYKILTTENLKNGISFRLMCYMCKHAGQSFEHLLLRLHLQTLESYLQIF